MSLVEIFAGAGWALFLVALVVTGRQAAQLEAARLGWDRALRGWREAMTVARDANEALARANQNTATALKLDGIDEVKH